ncbi:uridine kinase [Hyphodiscus hymeniophilus]|uniref:Uridine kinase n=1 Tax=Hyphodiscus hymeniophilus TaxID=353542 RepID=A0A9P6VHG0_9HELO|nr:uridine kinase [Hyphodiscus hymeniophilus]
MAGAPGAGKSTIAAEIVRRLNLKPANAKSPSTPSPHTRPEGPVAVCVGMDGFHYPRSYLDTLPNRNEAYARRGAPWTFDVHGILSLMRRLREWADRNPSLPNQTSTPPTEVPILAPSFSHTIKDPVSDGIQIPSTVSIILVEGNYLLLEEDGWSDVSPLVDLRIFIDVDLAIARERLARRHVAAGIEQTLEDALRRVDRNDYLNGRLIKDKLVQFDLLVTSVEDKILGT